MPARYPEIRVTPDLLHGRLALDVLCLVCHAPLTLHQPDCDTPDRLLGTCGACGAWHLVDRSTEASWVAIEVLLLPGKGSLKAATRQALEYPPGEDVRSW